MKLLTRAVSTGFISRETTGLTIPSTTGPPSSRRGRTVISISSGALV